MQAAEYPALRALEDAYWWHAGLRQLIVRTLGHLPAGPAPAILDLGCGTGGNLALLQRELPQARLYGTDLHPLAIALASRRNAGALCRASANALPYREASFDAVLALDVFYALEVDEAAALRESHRVLKPGGILLLNLPAFEALRGAHDKAVHTRQRYSAPELRTKLGAAGFEVLRLTCWNILLLPLLYAWRRLSPQQGSDLTPLHPALNGLLKLLLRMERLLFEAVDLPVGSSLFAVARRPTGTSVRSTP